jgi:N-acetylmuramoyl-L-alanine amidase
MWIESRFFKIGRCLQAIIGLWVASSSLLFPVPANAGFSRAQRVEFQRSIIDRQYTLNRRYKKIPRKNTKYIIVHTSEGGLRSTLYTVSKGKRIRKSYRTYGGHTHYVIARNGRTYRILNRRYIADHAGKSMWNGQTRISNVSVSIEMVGYHYSSITKQQYRSVGTLIDILKDVYGLNDRAVLTHSQIAYGKPNRWIRKNHRGRKKCANNFQRAAARLGPTWPYDPDTRAGRLKADPKLAAIYYTRKKETSMAKESNVINKENTAWSIAGEDFDDPKTMYRLPDGNVVRGDLVEALIGWDRVPEKTVVLLNQEQDIQTGLNQGPVKTISGGLTAWSFAGQAYNDKSTIYFYPDGQLKSGREISDWDDLPSGTKLIVGYQGPFKVGPKKSPARIARTRYRHKETLYYLPNRTLIPGDRIKDFTDLPKGVMMFLPTKGS